MKTPQQSYPKLAEVLNVPEIYLKREDLHKYGSHKGRSIPLMIKRYFKEGFSDFTISSSGNAALAAAYAVQAHNRNNPEKQITLSIFVGKNINPKKLKKLNKLITGEKISLHQVERPKQEAFQLDKSGKAKNLRQSTDDLALEGYSELANELNKIPNLQAVFIPTSSGTATQAIGEMFKSLENHPQIHIVQTEACHPIIKELGNAEIEEKQNSIADAIVDNIAHRKEKVIEIVKNSNGAGWVVDDEEIQKAINTVKATTSIDISPNSALSVAALNKAVNNGTSFIGPVACIITGA